MWKLTGARLQNTVHTKPCFCVPQLFRAFYPYFTQPFIPLTNPTTFVRTKGRVIFCPFHWSSPFPPLSQVLKLCTPIIPASCHPSFLSGFHSFFFLVRDFSLAPHLSGLFSGSSTPVFSMVTRFSVSQWIFFWRAFFSFPSLFWLGVASLFFPFEGSLARSPLPQDESNLILHISPIC